MPFGDLFKKKIKKSVSGAGNDSLRSPEVLGVNLVKDEIVVTFDWRKHMFLSVLVLAVVGLFVFEIYSGLGYWEEQENQRAEELRSKTDVLKMEVLNLNTEHAAAISFRDKSSSFAELLENHIYWTRFFDWLQKNTLNTVSYQGFSGDLSGIYEISAQAPSYAEASWQVKAFANSDVVKNIKVSSVEAAGSEDNKPEMASGTVPIEGIKDIPAGEVSFRIHLEINPEIFRGQE